MINQFIEIPAGKTSTSKRRLIFGVGSNDASYLVRPIVDGNKVMCPIYRKWYDMLKRCYSKSSLKSNPSYLGCSVCDEWLVFSRFKKWMEKQDWQGKELDKDVIKPGNKIYSPDNCAFISQSLNMLLVNKIVRPNKLPKGVHLHSKTMKFRAIISHGGVELNLGYFDTKAEASNTYIKKKVEIILDAAADQSDVRITNGLRLHANILSEGYLVN